MLDLRVLGAWIVTGSGAARLDLGVRSGQVVDLYSPGTSPSARETIDAEQLVVLPGIVDAHFHCRAPGHPAKEDFATGTKAAAAGGVTTVLEMPISMPGVHNAAILDARRALGERDAHVDFGLYGGGGSAARDIAEMARAGAIGFKIFLRPPPPGREVEFEGLCAADGAALWRALRRIRPTGLPVAIHAEDEELLQLLSSELMAVGDTRPAAHERSRPDFVEALAVSRVLIMAEALGVRAHLPHISTGIALRLVADAKRRGVSVTVETCPHYLLLDDSVLDKLGPYAKTNPPLRPRPNQEALWAGIEDGTVDIVASDHAPHTPAEKEVGWENIFAAPPGTPGVETLGPTLWDAALTGRMTLGRAVELLSERPAEIFGLASRKGFLRPGSDADFVILDPRASWTVSSDALMTRSKDSARLFQDRTLRGRVHATYLRGTVAYASGTVQNDPGSGRFVRPDRAGPQ